MKWWIAAMVMALSANADSAADSSTVCSTVQTIRAMILAAPANRVGARATRKFDFARTASCLADETGTRQALLIALPAGALLQVTAATSGDGKKGMMPLAVSVLDADRNLISSHAFETFLQRGTRYTHSFHRSAGHHGAFLLLEADRTVLGKSRSLVSGVRSTTMWLAGGLLGTYSDGREQVVEIPMKESGKVDIEIERLDSTD